MTPAETLAVLDLVTAYSPVVKLNAGTPAVWAHSLADVTRDQAAAAVHAHFQTSDEFITVATVRSHVAAELGLLPPTEAEATDPRCDHPLAVDHRARETTGYDYRAEAETDTRRVLAGNLAVQAAALARLPDLPPHPGPEPWLDREAWTVRSLLGNARIVDDWRDRLYARRDARTGRDALRERLTTAARAVPPSAGTNVAGLLPAAQDGDEPVTRPISAPIEPA